MEELVGKTTSPHAHAKHQSDELPDTPQLFESIHSHDNRGTFSKPLHGQSMLYQGFVTQEIFWTTSSRGTIRGLHFQTQPHEVRKLIWVSLGDIIDVVVDIRPGSSFGAVRSFSLHAGSANALWVPPGFAHGFQALTDGAIVNYATDGAYAPAHDTGIRWDSVGFDWPLPVNQVSTRDQSFESLEGYQARYNEDTTTF